MSDRAFASLLRLTALVMLAALALFLLAVLPAPAAAPQDVTGRHARPPQAILCDCSCWVCLCSQHVTCGEKGCRHPRPQPPTPTPPAPKAAAPCDRCQKSSCGCGCKGPKDCACPAEPRHGETRPAKDGGPAWTYDAKKEMWWRKWPAAPAPASPVRPIPQPAPLYLPPPMLFRPPPLMGGFGGGRPMMGGCRGGG